MSNKNLLISLIIPIYNVENTIERCAKSIFTQTISDSIEYIFIDDKSPDHSISLLESYIQSNGFSSLNYKILRLTYNAGLAKARYIGIQNASCDYIGFCDSDDWAEPDMYESLLNAINSTKSDISECGFYISSNGNDKIIEIKSSKDYIADLISNRHHCCVWNKLFRRSLFDGILYVPTQNMGEDFAFTTQLFLQTNRISQINRPLYHYWKNDSSISNKSDIESTICRGIQLMENSNLVFSALSQYNLLHKYSKEILVRKVLTKNKLSNYMNKKEVRLVFNKIFPEITPRVLFKDIPIGYKIYYFLAVTTLKSQFLAIKDFIKDR